MTTARRLVPPHPDDCRRRARPERPAGRHPRGGRHRVHRDRRARRFLPRGQCAGGAGVLGHRALGNGGARARGLPRPAPHERRPHPDRQGLPLLRRPPHRARRPRSRPAPSGDASSSSRCTARWRRCSSGASGLLSELTSYAAVVVGPSHDTATIRSVQLVGLSPLHALLVVVLSDGAVEKRTIELDAEISEEMLARAGDRARLPPGRADAVGALDRPGERVRPRRPAGRRRARAFDSMEGAIDADQVFVGGPARLAESFDAVETVRSVLAILEQQLVVVTLLRDVLDRGLSVAIGTEHGFEPLSSCAVVVAPVSVDGQDLGAVGLLGPTRMDYPRAMAAAHVVGERLGRAHRRRTRWPSLTGWATSTSCSGSVPTPATRRSSAPTGPAPASCIPTPTRATPRPRRASRR